ncbi:DNA-processing protein DprA [Desulfovibrio sp. TomC]|uniref:DNA-processing protein DprA n=1 Tax=Desulfovibrio sp. TomC TaxID=1562888 RepID=UPI0005750C73|nr:DNA-processing protein DprA [Desulfovibrio sp. TomC]KHK02286.1 Rossmann fold nucleotide-binding protein Smf possibly involved in DNA uptake [Desulfovibrio sp. TomC]
MTDPVVPSAPPEAWTADAGFVAECLACLRLRHQAGVGPRTIKRIFDRYPSAVAALAEARSFGPQGLCDDAAAGSLARGLTTPAAEAELSAAAAKGLTPLPYFHAAYPSRLRELPDPPAVLYVIGDACLLAGPCVAMVGARQCSRYGFGAAYDFAVGLSAAGITVVSGLAYGIDRQAHLGGLAGPGRSVAVLGTGLDLVYPDANLDVWRELAAGGAIISEFAPGTPPRAANFPVRNRIIAGLSLGVMVVEAADRSGSLITARLALEQGREVFALPGPVNLPTFSGCHALLSQGARLVQSAGDIVSGLARELAPYVDAPRPVPPGRPARTPAPASVAAPAPRPAPRRASPAGAKAAPQAGPAGLLAPRPASRPAPGLPEGLGSVEAGVLTLLADGAKHHIDAMGTVLSVAAKDLSSALVLLELKGLVRKWPGMYYTGEAQG